MTSPRRIESLTSGRYVGPAFPQVDLWWLKSRALLAKAEGTRTATPSWPSSTSRFAKKLDARGRLDEARQMVDEIG